MTRSEAIARLDELAADLERDLALCQTRDQHLRIATRIADARRLSADLAVAPAA